MALQGIKSLGARTVVSQVLRIVSSLFLARLLVPDDYGLFAVGSYIIGLGLYLGDVGMSGALIRQADEPTRDQYYTAFWSQQILVLLVVTTICLCSPLLVSLYQLPASATPLLIAMAAGLFLWSLRVVPMISMERKLQFGKIARIELFESIALAASLVLFAYLRMGAWALAGAGLVRGFVGLYSTWRATPRRLGGQFRVATLRDLARFGVPFQLNALVPALAGGWLPLIVGRMLGTTAVGLVSWSINIASAPMMLSVLLNRVAFPAYSRLHPDPEAFAHYLNSSVRQLNTLLWPTVSLVVIGCPVLIPVLFGTRWAPAVPLVQCLAVESILLTLIGIMGAAQNACGHPRDRLYVALSVGIAKWILTYAAVVHLGLYGLGPALLSITLCEVLVTAVLVEKRNAACAGLAWSILSDTVTWGAALVLAMVAGGLMASGGVAQQAIASVLAFVGSVAALELFGLSGLLVSGRRTLAWLFSHQRQ